MIANGFGESVLRPFHCTLLELEDGIPIGHGFKGLYMMDFTFAHRFDGCRMTVSLPCRHSLIQRRSLSLLGMHLHGFPWTVFPKRECDAYRFIA